jgi:RNA recognition motif-containing protein
VTRNLDHGWMESLFVSNLPYDLSSDEFRAAFERFGDVAEVTIATNWYHGRRQSQGYGFVDFRDEGGLQACLDSRACIELKGRMLDYRAARPRARVTDTAFVSGLPDGISDDELLHFFNEFPPLEAKVVRGAAAGRPGFGYARFESQDIRDRAITAKNGQKLKGNEIVVRAASRPFRSDEEQSRYEHSRRS